MPRRLVNRDRPVKRAAASASVAEEDVADAESPAVAKARPRVKAGTMVMAAVMAVASPMAAGGASLLALHPAAKGNA